MKRIYLMLIFTIVSAVLQPSYLCSKESKLYVVTRSTKKFRLKSRDNPTIGLFSTNDQGKTWQHYGWKYTRCFSVSIARLKRQRVFYLSCGNGVLKSSDQGLTNKTIYALAFAPQEPNIIYAGTFRGGIFKSTDKGNSWKSANNGQRILDIHALLVDPKNINTVYAGTLNDGIWISEDGKKNWQFIGLETSQVWDMIIQ